MKAEDRVPHFRPVLPEVGDFDFDFSLASGRFEHGYEAPMSDIPPCRAVPPSCNFVPFVVQGFVGERQS